AVPIEQDAHCVATQIHISLRLDEHYRKTANHHFGRLRAGLLSPPGASRLFKYPVNEHEPEIVPRSLILTARVTDANNELHIQQTHGCALQPATSLATAELFFLSLTLLYNLRLGSCGGFALNSGNRRCFFSHARSQNPCNDLLLINQQLYFF